MSLLKTIKGWGKGQATAPASATMPSSSQFGEPGARRAAGVRGASVLQPTQVGIDGYDTSTALPTESLDSSIITEAAPTQSDDPAAAHAAAAGHAAGGLPLIGRMRLARQQAILGGMLLVGITGLLVSAFSSIDAAGRSAAQVAASGQALMQSQRLAKSVSQALGGSMKAFAELRESSQVLSRSVLGLQRGDEEIPAVSSAVKEVLEPLVPLVERAGKNAGVVLAQQHPLTQVAAALRSMSQQLPSLFEAAEAFAAVKLQQDASAAEMSAADRMVMLTQRLGRTASEFLTPEGASPQAVAQLGKDLDAFRDIGQALAAGSAEMRLPPVREGQARIRLAAMMEQYEAMRRGAEVLLRSQAGLAAAREAQVAILADSEPLRQGLQAVQQRLGAEGGFTVWNLALLLVSAMLVVAGGYGFLRLYVRGQAGRAAVAQGQRMQAERMEQEAKRVNDANQAAILRLMNELQAVAEGDLTQQATVTEDITGAIADSVNYTVEELRTLVSQVQGAVARVTDTTQQVESTSTELLAVSGEQLREIRDTGESVLQMAERINGVSAQAQQTAEVARQSLSAAESGLKAVENTIGGMNAIRDQIQETSKRIKRLGESSQEIGEITELISDITEQTNVLALNAAIQAASAGDAGRGFSVVAEEVQRLAERSADATRQIAALVRAIQTDTQDAMGAMERSTQGVVEGTRLSDAAGTALAEIDRVSRRLAELIGQISSEALSEAQSASVVATNIQHIFAVTEQTGEGTRSTAQIVRELSKTAEELKKSVARFKIG